MSKRKILSFPMILNYSVLVSIIGVVWSSPLTVVNQSEIGKLFQPWFISLIPLVMYVSIIIASYLKDISASLSNKCLIGTDLIVFMNTVYMLFSKDYKTFIIIDVLAFVLFIVFGRAYGIKIKDIISKLYQDHYLEYQARTVRYEGLIKFFILLVGLVINLLWSKEGYYDPIIYYSLLLGVVSISYEIWYMRPLRILETKYLRKLNK